MPSPTTADVVLADFVEAIKGIAPAVTQQSEQGFRFVHSRQNVEAGALRTFTLEATPSDEGVAVSCGNDFPFELDVVVSYKGMTRFKAQGLVIEDRRQWWQTLYLRVQTLEGLWSVVERGAFAWLNTIDSECWGLHPYLVRYVASDSP